MNANDSLLDVAALEVRVSRRGTTRQLIRNVNFGVRRGESLGLVGESGSGKSVTVRAILRFLDDDAIVSGNVEFAGEPVYGMDRERLRRWHRDDVAMIYQDPRAHINPLRTVGDFLTEALRLAHGMDRAEAGERATSVLQSVGINNADARMHQYPHQLSGGLLQRVMIASALLIGPQLIVADEPTTALDVTTQEEVMAILDELRRERDLAMIFITHDLDLAAAVTDRLASHVRGSHRRNRPFVDHAGRCKAPLHSGAARVPPKYGRNIGTIGDSGSAHRSMGIRRWMSVRAEVPVRRRHLSSRGAEVTSHRPPLGRVSPSRGDRREPHS